jgi:AcrR family transcriptional regulator
LVGFLALGSSYVNPRPPDRIAKALKQAARRELTRRAVLDAAHGVFGRRGYHEATLREIAEVAGVSKGAVYYNFANKEELFLALLEARMEERLREVAAAYEQPDSGTDPSERAAGDYIENLKRNPEWVTLFLEFLAHAARDELFRAKLAARFKRFWAELAKVVERRAREQGVRLPLPAEHLAVAIDALGIGFMVPQILEPEELPEDLLGKSLAYLLGGVAEAAQQGHAPPRGGGSP